MLALWSATYSPKAAFAATVTAIETRQHVDPNGIAIEPTSGSVFVTFPPSIDFGDDHGQIIVYDGDPISDRYQHDVLRGSANYPNCIVYNPHGNNFFISDSTTNNVISVVSLVSAQVTQNIVVGRPWIFFPANEHSTCVMLYNPSNNDIYVSYAVQAWPGSAEEQRTGNEEVKRILVVVDTDTNTPVGTIDFGNGQFPLSLAYNPANDRIYAAMLDGTIRIIDGKKGSPMENQILPGVFARGISGIDDIAFSPNNGLLYILRDGGYSGYALRPNNLGSLMIMNPNTGEIIEDMTIDRGLHSIAFNPENGDAYITNEVKASILSLCESSVTVVSGASRSVLGTINLESCPWGIVYNPKDEKFYLPTGEVTGLNPSPIRKSLIEVIDPSGLEFGIRTVLHGKLLTTPEYREIPIGSTLPPRMQVFDTAIFQFAGPIPTGTVTYYRYENSDCAVDPDNPSAVKVEEVQIQQDGTVPASSVFAITKPGPISYRAGYNGDINYDPTLSDCEPQNISPIFTSLQTEDGADVTGKRVYVGTILHDTATLILGLRPVENESAVTGTVTYQQFNNGNCIPDPDATPGWSDTVRINDDGSVSPSRTMNMTTAGDYSFRAIYNLQYYSPCETISVDPVPTVGPPIRISDSLVADIDGNPLSSVPVGSQAVINFTISNNYSSPGQFVVIVLIEDSNGATESISWEEITIDANKSTEYSLSWSPTSSGNHTIETFVWSDLANQVPIANPNFLEVSVDRSS